MQQPTQTRTGAQCRRKRTRVHWEGEVTLWVGSHRLACQGVDLSETGIALHGEWGAYPGQFVTVEFELFGSIVHATGVVAWSRTGGARRRWGIAFRFMMPSHRERLGAYVSSRHPDGFIHEDSFEEETRTMVFDDPQSPPLPPPPDFAGWDASAPDSGPRVRTGETVVASPLVATPGRSPNPQTRLHWELRTFCPYSYAGISRAE